MRRPDSVDRLLSWVLDVRCGSGYVEPADRHDPALAEALARHAAEAGARRRKREANGNAGSTGNSRIR